MQIPVKNKMYWWRIFYSATYASIDMFMVNWGPALCPAYDCVAMPTFRQTAAHEEIDLTDCSKSLKFVNIQVYIW